uniref:Uncharacterized protein n=1 Tax=Oryza brachyantha TaxID=4533 RepID=J3MFW7_ORYBR
MVTCLAHSQQVNGSSMPRPTDRVYGRNCMYVSVAMDVWIQPSSHVLAAESVFKSKIIYE